MSVRILEKHKMNGKYIVFSKILVKLFKTLSDKECSVQLHYMWLKFHNDYNVIINVLYYILPKLHDLCNTADQKKIMIHHDQYNLTKVKTISICKQKRKILHSNSNSVDKIFYLYQNYLYLYSDNQFLEDINNKLIKTSRESYIVNDLTDHYLNPPICQSCLDLKKDVNRLSEKHNDILKRYSLCQKEKEKMVVTYARSEKQILESKNLESSTRKQLQDLEKINNLLQRKYEKLQVYAAKLSKDVVEINLEKTYLQRHLKYQHDEDNKSKKTFISTYSQCNMELITLPEENAPQNSEECFFSKMNFMEKENIQYISSFKLLENQVSSFAERIKSLEQELSRIILEKKELQTDIDSYRLREVQLQEFIQKLIEKNVEFQCDLAQLQSDYKNCRAHSTFYENENVIDNIQILQENLTLEKIKHQEECEKLASYIAELSIFNKKLSKNIESLKGENNVTLKKYQLTLRMMTRELLFYDMICKNLIKKDLQVNINARSNYQNTGRWPEDELLFNRIIELQLLNKKHAEKVEFLEEHSKILMKELQKQIYKN